MVVITGAAGTLGRALSEATLACGAHVVLVCRSLHQAQHLAAELRTHTTKGQVTAMQCDLASLGAVRAFAAELLATGWPLHVLIHAAAVMAVGRYTSRRAIW